ncbi:MAG: MarR family transcriptional regulator, partial [Actinomycetota bacterium]
LGLSSGDADVLTAIRVADYDPVPSEIAQWLGLTGAGATGRLNSLERRGLLERLPHPTDGRSVTLHLTEAGLQLADAVIDAKNTTVVNAVSEQLGEGRAQQLVAELDALTAVAREAMDRR